MPRDLDPTKVRYFLKNKKEIGRGLRELFAVPISAVNLTEWQDFFRHVLGRDVDLLNLHVPAKPNYPCRALVIPSGVTNNNLYDACMKRFNCWRYTDDLNAITDIVSRPDGPYVIWARDTQEADLDMANISANQIKERGVNTETLKERLVHELKFHNETGKHLDIYNRTLCAGSRRPDGNVPYVSWFPGYDRMVVSWCLPESRHDEIRARAAVS